MGDEVLLRALLVDLFHQPLVLSHEARDPMQYSLKLCPSQMNCMRAAKLRP